MLYTPVLWRKSENPALLTQIVLEATVRMPQYTSKVAQIIARKKARCVGKHTKKVLVHDEANDDNIDNLPYPDAQALGNSMLP